MRIFPGPIAFEWDKGNLDKNWATHGVTNQEAEEVFLHGPKVMFEDETLSRSERRHLVWGMTSKRRTLAVVFTMRKNRMRIISARDMSKKERRRYEKKVQEHPKI